MNVKTIVTLIIQHAVQMCVQLLTRTSVRLPAPGKPSKIVRMIAHLILLVALVGLLLLHLLQHSVQVKPRALKITRRNAESHAVIRNWINAYKIVYLIFLNAIMAKKTLTRQNVRLIMCVRIGKKCLKVCMFNFNKCNVGR